MSGEDILENNVDVAKFTPAMIDAVEKRLNPVDDVEKTSVTQPPPPPPPLPILNAAKGGECNDVDYNKSQKKKPHKQRVIDDIMRIYEQKGEKKTRRPFTRMKLAQLEALLGKLVNDTCLETMAPQNVEVEKPPQTGNVKDDYAVNSLYQMNLVFAGLVEKTTQSYQDSIGFHMDGYKSELEKNRKELLEVLRQIYLENQETIKDFISPTSAYLMLMVGCAVSSIQKNASETIKEAEVNF